MSMPQDSLGGGAQGFFRLSVGLRWRLALGVGFACAAALASFGLLFLSGWLLAGAAVAGLGGKPLRGPSILCCQQRVCGFLPWSAL